MSLAVRPLAADTWDDFAALVDAHGGIFGGCWCLVFHPGTKVRGYEERRALKAALVREDRAHAALVYEGGACLGWAQFGSPAEVSEIRNRKAYEEGRGDAARPDWRVTCFFTAKGHRREGVAGAALEGALGLIAEAGGGEVEGYPEEMVGQPRAPGMLWGGTLGLFEARGFTADRRIGKHRWVVRRRVEPARRHAEEAIP